jgi:mannosyltransferase
MSEPPGHRGSRASGAAATAPPDAGSQGASGGTAPAGGQASPVGQTDAAGPAGGARWAAAVRIAPVAAACAVMVVLGIWGLTRDNAMGNDEVASKWAALLSLRELAHLLRHVDAVHGLYYLILHAWVVFGSSPTIIRVPSVIAATVGVALTVILGRRLTGSGWAGLFAGLIMALTPVISYYAQTARSYAMVVACVLAATLALLHALSAEAADPSRPATRRWVLYAALIALGGYLNEMSLLVLAAHGVTVLLARYGRPVFQRWLVAAVVGGVAVTPVLGLSVLQHAAVSWIGRPGIPAFRTLFHDYFGATTGIALLVLACAVIAVLPGRDGEAGPAGTAAATDREGNPLPWWRSGGVSLPSVAAPLLVLPAFLLLAESEITHPLYVDRYVLYGEAGAALLAGAGAYRIGLWLVRRAGRVSWQRAVWAPGALICALVLVLQIAPQQRVRTPGSRAYDFGSPSFYLAAHARPGDGVLFLGNFFRKAELGYPAQFRKVTDFGEAKSPMEVGNFRGTDKPFNVVLPIMLSYHRIWEIGLPPTGPLPAGLLSQEGQALRAHFTLIFHHRYRGLSLTLWQRNS